MGKKKRFKSFEELSGTYKSPTRKQKEKKLLKELEQRGKVDMAKGKKAAEPEPEPVEDEMGDFFAAMQGVDPIDGGGRAVAPRPEPGTPPQPEDPAEELRRLVGGEVTFELEYTDEYMYGHVRGLDTKVLRKLKAGAYSVEAHQDLHGLNSDQAYDALLFFLRESQLQGKRCVLVVTGRGRNSPGGQSVLKQEIQNWLVRDPLRRSVLAFCTANPKDGGAGAIYVLLRKNRKEQGKVNFEKLSNWND